MVELHGPRDMRSQQRGDGVEDDNAYAHLREGLGQRVPLFDDGGAGEHHKHDHAEDSDRLICGDGKTAGISRGSPFRYHWLCRCVAQMKPRNARFSITILDAVRASDRGLPAALVRVSRNA